MEQPPLKTVAAQLRVSRQLFYSALLCLPIMWVIHFLYFFPFLKRPETPKEIKIQVWLSLTGAVVSVVALATWLLLFIFQWRAWGVTGEDLIMIIPD